VTCPAVLGLRHRRPCARRGKWWSHWSNRFRPGRAVRWLPASPAVRQGTGNWPLTAAMPGPGWSRR